MKNVYNFTQLAIRYGINSVRALKDNGIRKTAKQMDIEKSLNVYISDVIYL